MKDAILKNWTFSRGLRLIIGLAIIVQALVSKDTMFGVAGLLFISMAVFNIGCCGAGGCATAPKKTDKNSKDITYEEVV